MMSSSALAKSSVIDLLNWQDDLTSPTLCRGYFAKPKTLSSNKADKDITQTKTTITAQNSVTYSNKGDSALQGEVTITQAGRILKADSAWLRRNPNTHTITAIDLLGNVRYISLEGNLAALRATVQLDKNTAELCGAAFHIPNYTTAEGAEGWGTADNVVRDKEGNLHLINASYSTCSPKNKTWSIVANKLDMNKDKGIGYAQIARFRLHDIPILYLPGISFPLDQRRKSGFLVPGMSYSNENGLDVVIPYYFNFAPNYDSTLTVRALTERGIQFSTITRYLTENSKGAVNFSILPHDSRFADFKEKALESYRDDPLRQPYLSRIDNADTYRAMLKVEHVSDWQPHWRADVLYNWVSDDYYYQDFGNNPIIRNTDQLPQIAQLQYQDYFWRIFGRIERYQTLHPLDTIAREPYNRIPQVFAESYMPDQLLGADISVYADFNRFDHRRFFITDSPVITGERLHIRPGLTLPYHKPYGYLEAKSQLDLTGYWLHYEPNEIPNKTSRVLPIFSIDSGLFLDRSTTWFNRSYVQTLEPRAYYLFVPNSNQNEIPIFDTAHPPVNFEQMFYHNRFSGADRLGDANQIALALTSRILDGVSQAQMLSIHLGSIVYLMDRNVCLVPNCTDDPTSEYKISPIIAGLNVQFNDDWSFNGNFSWDPRNYLTNTAFAKFHYQPTPDSLMNIGYEFVREGDIQIGRSSNNLSRLDISFAWPITQNVSLIGDWNYNVSHSYPQAYFAGLSYESCCWAIRAIASRTRLDTDLNDNAKFDTKYYLQIKLKGLGTIANDDPHSLLTDGIDGFYDHF